MIRVLVKSVVWIVLSLLGLFLLFLAFATIKDYNPDERIVIHKSAAAPLFKDSIISIITWNIGYAGLDKNMDFFYDGGHKTRSSRQQTLSNLTGICNLLAGAKDSVNFMLLQEVDQSAHRTYAINEVDTVTTRLNFKNSAFGKNYDVLFVPVPFTNPMGRAVSGIITLSKAEPAMVTRVDYPGNFSWPTRIFMLDRCFLENRYTLPNGKELVLINTHNSTFDDGSVKKEEMEFLKNYLLHEGQKGNYVVVGGDWNQSPPGLEKKLNGFIFDREDYSEIPADFTLPGWKWVYQPGVPTNRRLKTGYDKSTTPTTIIDLFYISPKIDVLKINTLQHNFEVSDHNPVFVKLKLNY